MANDKEPELEFRCSLPHHEDSEAKMEVHIENGYVRNHFGSGAVMSVKTDGGHVYLTREELDKLNQIFKRYDRAVSLMEGKSTDSADGG